MASKSVSITEEKLEQLNQIAAKLGYETKGKLTPEKQLIDDILDAIIDSKDWINGEVKIKDLIGKGIRTKANLSQRDSDKERSVKAFEKLEKLIQNYASEGIKHKKTYYNKTHKINYNFLIEYEKNHPGVFA